MSSPETAPAREAAASPNDQVLAADGPLRLSIVIPTFRRNAYLPPLFEILQSQVETVDCPVEVLLVDNSPEGAAAGITGPDMVRYVHEPQSGVAHARNRGVAEARGSHVIFLDDDERPTPGWLATFATMAAQGFEACFGSIEPQFEVPPPPSLHAPLSRLFSRELPAAAGADVTGLRAYLGSGNSLFRRETLTRISPPFDVAFNAGGEDVWLFRQLVDDYGVRLTWAPAARVREMVPSSRISIDFLRRRRFSDGQLRCLVESGKGGIGGAAHTALWMGVGAAQLALGGLGAVAVRPVSSPLSVRLGLMATGGGGKLLWWRRKAGSEGK